jgi:dTDP-4-dehydrorhamnose reductase
MSKALTTEPGCSDILGDWMDKLEQRAEIRCANDQIFSPVDVNDVVDALIRLTEAGNSGFYHVCCPRPVSRLGLLNLLVEEIRQLRALDTHIVSCSIRDFDFPERRPLDTSMSPAKLYATLGEDFDDLSLVCRVAVTRRYGMPAHA